MASVLRSQHRDTDSAAVGSYGQMCTAAGGCWGFRPLMNQPRWLETMAIYSDSSGGQEIHTQGKRPCSSLCHLATALPGPSPSIFPPEQEPGTTVAALVDFDHSNLTSLSCLADSKRNVSHFLTEHQTLPRLGLRKVES